jgi:hypothetical protein
VFADQPDRIMGFSFEPTVSLPGGTRVSIEAAMKILLGESQPSWNYARDGEHPEYPLADWRYEVYNGDTLRSYQQWVEARLGIVENRPEPPKPLAPKDFIQDHIGKDGALMDGKRLVLAASMNCLAGQGNGTLSLKRDGKGAWLYVNGVNACRCDFTHMLPDGPLHKRFFQLVVFNPAGCEPLLMLRFYPDRIVARKADGSKIWSRSFDASDLFKQAA